MGERVVISPDEAEPIPVAPLEYGTGDNSVSKFKRFAQRVYLWSENACRAMRDHVRAFAERIEGRWQVIFAVGFAFILGGIGCAIDPRGPGGFFMFVGGLFVGLSVRLPFLRK